VNTSERNRSAAIFGVAAPNTPRPEVAALVRAAQHDLALVVDLLAEETDCLVALVLLARAAKNTDEAVFALLDGHAANARKDPYNIPTRGMLNFIATTGVPDD
jgi:hypothetical protein